MAQISPGASELTAGTTNSQFVRIELATTSQLRTESIPKRFPFETSTETIVRVEILLASQASMQVVSSSSFPGLHFRQVLVEAPCSTISQSAKSG